jgi:DNA-binding transcriptional LysR family regulator
MRITLRQLAVFVAVARDDGVTAAGQRIGLSQAAVSQALADLESAIGRQLFDRVGRRVILNTAGRALLAQANEVLERVETIERGAAATRPVLNLGASVTLGNHTLPQVLVPFMRANASCEVSVTIRNTQEMLDPLLRAQVDMALVEGTLVHRELQVQPWRSDALVLVVAPQHPLAGRTARPADLAEQSWILREQGSGTREAFERAISSHFKLGFVALDAGGNELLKEAVRNNLGIGCISATAVAEELRSGTLARIDTPWLDLSRIFSVVLHRSRQPESTLLQFLMHCREWAVSPYLEQPFWQSLGVH